MELPLFAILQRTPRVAVTLAFVLFLLTIVPALYSLLANQIFLPLSISSSETYSPSPLDHTRLSHLNSSSNQILSPVNAPIPAPPDNTPSKHRKSSFHRSPTPENGPIPSPTDHIQRSSSSDQVPSPKNGPIPAPLNHTSFTHRNSSSYQSPSPVNGPIPTPLDHTSLRYRIPSSDQSPSPVDSPIPAPLNHTSLGHHNSSSDPISSSHDHSSPVTTSRSRTQITNDEPRCDLFTGEWVPNKETPYYTNTTCRAIHEHQNCMKYGRPDTEFMRWKWKPDGCDLPIFDPQEFLGNG
ncbi:Protein trichome birefringence-like 21 [Cardamine amara subsp. amara]|uniref:Protein trichome birefringence-like 21 n=1 Tax=Cardamine amara subsp. amara TaxID=228776 RepID=A0ABD1AGH2_CARAN